jgi:MFS family permease
MTMLTTAALKGGIFGGLVAPLLTGWLGILLAGGILPIAIGVLMLFLLWESPKVLAARGLAEIPAVLKAFRLKSADLPQTRASAAANSTQPTGLLKNGHWLITFCHVSARSAVASLTKSW